jgi:hypothetical protein
MNNQSYIKYTLNYSINSETLTASDSTSTEIESISITELKATGQVVQKLHEGWDNIHKSNLENFEKARVSG